MKEKYTSAYDYSISTDVTNSNSFVLSNSHFTLEFNHLDIYH